MLSVSRTEKIITRSARQMMDAYCYISEVGTLYMYLRIFKQTHSSANSIKGTRKYDTLNRFFLAINQRINVHKER